MSSTPHTRDERPHGGNKLSPHSSAKNGPLSRTLPQYPRERDSQGLTRADPSSTNVPRTFMGDISLWFTGLVWTSLSKPEQQALLLLVKEESENERKRTQYMMTQNTVTTTTTTSTVYSPVPRMESSYMVERVVQSESSRQQVVYLASGGGS